jgi:hypothetical protein
MALNLPSDFYTMHDYVIHFASPKNCLLFSAKYFLSFLAIDGF